MVTKEMVRAGIVGLGAMGEPIARNIIAAGLTLTAHDIEAVALDGIRAGGLVVRRTRPTRECSLGSAEAFARLLGAMSCSVVPRWPTD